jgi:hypothetical protein
MISKPLRWRRICGSTASVSSNAPKKFVSMTSRSSRSPRSSSAPTRRTPAIVHEHVDAPRLGNDRLDRAGKVEGRVTSSATMLTSTPATLAAWRRDLPWRDRASMHKPCRRLSQMPGLRPVPNPLLHPLIRTTDIVAPLARGHFHRILQTDLRATASIVRMIESVSSSGMIALSVRPSRSAAATSRNWPAVSLTHRSDASHGGCAIRAPDRQRGGSEPGASMRIRPRYAEDLEIGWPSCAQGDVKHCGWPWSAISSVTAVCSSMPDSPMVPAAGP